MIFESTAIQHIKDEHFAIDTIRNTIYEEEQNRNSMIQNEIRKYFIVSRAEYMNQID